MSDLRSELQAVYDQHGKLTPELVVEVARAKKHPLHALVFDRPLAEAAEAYYRDRAHELIRSVKVVYREATDTAPEGTGRAWLAVRSEGPNEYVYEPAEKVATDDFTRRLVLRDMEREWRQLYFRYQGFAEFVALVTGDLEAEVAGPGPARPVQEGLG